MKNLDIPSCKVTLIGDSGVGKTSIISRYISGIFQSDYTPSINMNYSNKIHEFNGQKVRLDIWDTAGQEVYKSIGRNFYVNAYIVILVYDITSLQSFENLKNIWYPEVKQYGEKYHILSLVGNKDDLFLSEKVKVEEATKFANEIGAQFSIISAKTGKGVDDLFSELGNKFLSPNFKKKAQVEYRARHTVKLKPNIIENKTKKCACSK